MARNSTENQTTPMNETFEHLCNDVKFRIKPETTYKDKVTGEPKISPRGIFLQGIGMPQPMKISARAVVSLFHYINDNDDVKAVLRARIAEEVQEKGI
jgi:hypothetical protein